MNSKPNKHKLRTERARAKLVQAAVAMIAERGLPGFALTNVGAEAGVSRALASYHFEGGRSELLNTALAQLLENQAEPEPPGLAALFRWIDEEAHRAARRDPQLLALLQLAVGPGVEGEAPELREEYWRRRTELIRRNLSPAQALGQIGDDLELGQLAALLLGLFHGELLRLAATGGAPTPAFRDLIERALAPERASSKGAMKKVQPPDAAATQGSLF